MTIIPVTTTTIDWNRFVRTIHEVTGRSPTRLLDKSNLAVGDHSSFLSSLAYFCCGLSPFEANRCTNLYRQLSYGFLIELTEKQYLSILKETDLFCTDNLSMPDEEKLVLITGTLSDWRAAILLFSNERQPPKLRLLFNTLYSYFLSQGLSDLFATHARRELEGNSFTLEEL